MAESQAEDVIANDDDMFVVIIEDDGNSTENPQEPEGTLDSNQSNVSDIEVKKEIMDCDIPVENIIEQASKHGQQLDIDLNADIKEEPIEYLEEDFDDDSQSDSNENSKNYYNTDDEDMDLKPKGGLFYVKNERHRYSMLTPSEQKSFVSELRQEYPDLEQDEDLLVNCLYEIMKTVKPPPPPLDYYVMNDVMLECVICGAMSETIPAAGRHYQEKHGPRYLICFSCGVDFRSTTNLYKHEKRCVNPDARIVLKARALYLSRRCRERPTRKKGDRTHAVDREKEKFRCPQCPAVFLAKVHLLSHLNLHEGRRPYKCDNCEAAYTSQSALKRHQKKHSDLKFICGTCGHVFKAKPALVSHMDTHRAEKKFGCSECSKRYATRFALKLHVDREHRRLPPPCPCQICPKRYARMSLLKEHMRKEHEMLLITRKMFFKSLPTLTKTQIEQAKVVFKSEVENNNNAEFSQTEDDAQEDDPQDNNEYEIEMEMLPEQLVEYLKNSHDTEELQIVTMGNGGKYEIDDANRNMVLDMDSLCVVQEQ